MSKIAPTLKVAMDKMQAGDKIWIVISLAFTEPKNLEDALGIDLPQDRTEYRQRLIDTRRQDVINQTEMTFNELYKIVGCANVQVTYLTPTMICQATKQQIEKIAQIEGVKRIVDDTQFSAEMLL